MAGPAYHARTHLPGGTDPLAIDFSPWKAFQSVVLADPDLFAYWVMNEASGTLADIGPHAITMAVGSGVPVYGVDGPFPPLTAVDLDNSYFEASISGALANLIFGDASVGVRHPFTIAAIANMPSLADANDAVFSARSGSAQVAMYFSTVGGDNVLYVQRDSDSTAGVEQPINRNLLLVFRYDGTDMELFVDGVLVDTAPANDSMGSWGTTPISIGGLGTPLSATSQAIVSNVALFGAAISDERIAALSAGFAMGGTGGSLNIDHGGLYGLADDDHPQYLLRSVVTTIGDLLVATASGVLARLANGTAGQVLEADPAGASPKVKWATRIKSLAKNGSAALSGDVTLTGGANVTLTQSGQDIEIAATVVGSGAVDSIAAAGDTPMIGDIEVVGAGGISVTQDDVDTLTISFGASDGWVDDTAATWTYASASTFTVTGDRTAEFQKGTRLKFTQTTVKYGVVASSAHAGGTTTVTIAVNTDYVLANAAISDNYYSYQDRPQGYPGWFNWAAAPTGYAASPTVVARFSISGGMCFCVVQFNGTSNATTTAFTLPVPTITSSDISAPCYIVNNGVGSLDPGFFNNSGTTACEVYRTLTLLGWTASNNKVILGQFHYPT